MIFLPESWYCFKNTASITVTAPLVRPSPFNRFTFTTFNYAGNNISFLYIFSPKKVLGQLPFRSLYTKEVLNYQTWNNILSLESSTLFLFVAWCSCQTPLHFCATTVSSHYSVIFSVFLLVFTPPLKEKSTSLCKNPNEMFLWQICVKCPKVKS